MAVGPNQGAYFNDTAATSFFTNMLREHYQDGVIDTLNNTNFLDGRHQSVEYQMEGKHWVFGLHTERGVGHGAIGPGGNLPDPDRQGYSRWRGPMRHHYGRIMVDRIGQWASESSVASWMQMVDGEVRGMAIDMARQRNRMLHNDGSGRLAQVLADVAGLTTVTVKLPQIPESPATMVGMPATYHLAARMRIAFIDPAGPTIEDAEPIASVDSDTSITMDNAVTVDEDDWLVNNTAATHDTSVVNTAYKREPVGYAGIFSDTNPLQYDTADAYEAAFVTDSFQNVDADVVANGYARANVIANGGVLQPPYETLIQQSLTTARKTNNAQVSLMLSSLELIDAYGSRLLADRRFMNVMTLSGGWLAVDFAGIPWFGDRDCYPNRIYFSDESQVGKAELEPYSWEDRDGLFQRLPDNDFWQAWFSGHWNMVCKVRDKLTLLTDLSEEVI